MELANNHISNTFINPSTLGGADTCQGSQTGGEEPSVQDLLEGMTELLSALQQTLGGGNSGAGAAGNSPGQQAFSNTPPNVPQGGGDNCGGGAGAGAAGEGMRDVKLNTSAGGEALHLQADNQGNLYNGSGNQVGVIGQDGSVSLNSGATQEMERLATGHNGAPIFNPEASGGERGAGGSMVYEAGEITVGAGDLNQKADF